VEQAAVDAELQLKAAQAGYQSLSVKLRSDMMTQKAGGRDGDRGLQPGKVAVGNGLKLFFDLGVISGLAYKLPRAKLTSSPRATILRTSD